jgi:diacylglycerol kinase family enzyme
MKPCAILYNPSSGKGRSIKEKRRILQCLKQEAVSFDLFISQSEAHLMQLAKEAVSQYPVVAAVGGDTTFNIVAHEILSRNKGTVMGMIGTGSANDIVRGLNIHHIQSACKAIKNGQTRDMDVGCYRVGAQRESSPPRYFLGTLSAGLGSTVNLYVESYHQRHPLLAKINPLTQLTAGLLGIRHSFNSRKLPLKTNLSFQEKDGGEWIKQDIRFSLLVFLNTPFYANGLKLAQGPFKESLFDGLLDCCIIDTTSFINTICTGLKMPKNKSVDLNEVSMLKAPSFKLSCEQTMDIQVDGDIIRDVMELHVSVLPGRLKVLV